MSLADHERTETVLEFAMRRMGKKFRPINIRNEKLFLTKAGDVFRPCFFSGPLRPAGCVCADRRGG